MMIGYNQGGQHSIKELRLADLGQCMAENRSTCKSSRNLEPCFASNKDVLDVEWRQASCSGPECRKK